jgi:ABC-2 type transport system permease protein
VPWFLRHELLLFWRSSGLTTGKRNGRLFFLKIALWSTVWLALHALAFVVVRKLGDGNLMPQLVLPITGLMLILFTLMLSSGLKASVEALFERGDMDLLLSSPVPSLSIFTARLLGITLGLAAFYLLLFAPFAHAGLLLGKFRWLSVYPVVLGNAAIAASLSMLLTLALVRMLGARRTRVVAQVLGALAGASIFLASQAYSHLGNGSQEATTHWLRTQMTSGALDPESPVWWPARALLGDTVPLLGLSMFAAISFFLTLRFTHSFFVKGLQAAASSARSAARPAKPVQYRFRSNLFEVTVVKEWRLILRDPHLISQILLQLLYLVPMFGLVFTGPDTALPGLGAGLTMVSATLGASLAWLTVLAEDAPDLLRASPANFRTIKLAKLAAAVMPPLMIAALPLLWLLATNPHGGLLASFPLVSAVVSAVLIVQWRRRPAARSDFTRRGIGDWTSNLLDMLNGIAWGAFAFLLIRLGSGAGDIAEALYALLALTGALAALSIAWFTRRRT